MSSREAAPNTWSRRDTLRLGAGLTVGTGLVALTGAAEPRSESLYRPELDEMMAAAAPYITDEQVPRPLPTQEQVAIDANSRLARRIGGTANHAVVVVHPGYLTQSISDTLARNGRLTAKNQLDADEVFTEQNIMQWGRQDIATVTNAVLGREGDYGAYRSYLERVYARANQQPETPMVVFTEARRLYSGEQRRRLETPRHALQIATIDADPSATERVRYQGNAGIETASQKEQLMYDWLARNNIDTVHIAGEYGLLPGSQYIDPACAGTVALNFIDRGFKVHGIEGAVFPSNPKQWRGPAKGYDASSRDIQVAKALHDNTVAI